MDYQLLNHINSPADLKQLAVNQLPDLCAELRDFIIRSLSHNPGHLASSLGTIELTVALHYVYDTPQDKLIWDVGHQAYAHKILTGRRERFHTNRQFGGLAPFPSPKESEYDAFVAGHASNSISAALGIEVAENKQTAQSKVVAVIGDGAMTGGLAYEGLNNVSMDKNNLLIVLNDNNMAIDKIRGGMTQYLVNLTTSPRYNRWRWNTYQWLLKHRLISSSRTSNIRNLSNMLKAIVSKQPRNIFTGLNIRYFGPTDGHDVIAVVRILREIKEYQGPKVLHIVTKKGKGYAPAENDQVVWHAPGEFNVETGSRLNGAKVELWQDVFGETLTHIAQTNEKVMGISPAMLSGCGMIRMQKLFPERVFDVGIAEGHAVTFSAGLAKGGAIPYCNIYSSFLQRAYDNIIHDVALQNLHVILCIDRAGIVGNDGATHHGLFDMAYLRPIPNLHIAAPRTADDLRRLLIEAQYMTFPLAIRYPRGKIPENCPEAMNQSAQTMQATQLLQGEDVAVLTIGPIGNIAYHAIVDAGLNIALYDMRWLKPLDNACLDSIGKHYRKVVTIEDGILNGGLGSAVAEYMTQKGYPVQITRLGVDDQFVEHGSTAELFHLLHLDKEGIADSLTALCEPKEKPIK